MWVFRQRLSVAVTHLAHTPYLFVITYELDGGARSTSQVIDDRRPRVPEPTGPVQGAHGGLDMDFQDKTLTCRECHNPFVWTAGEQVFYKERGLINIPGRCAECRSNRRERLGQQRQSVTEVVCAECGTTTTVPFVPRNGKPVYCSTCLAGVREREEPTAPLEHEHAAAS